MSGKDVLDSGKESNNTIHWKNIRKNDKFKHVSTEMIHVADANWKISNTRQ
jgi:hypothetical protein